MLSEWDAFLDAEDMVGENLPRQSVVKVESGSPYPKRSLGDAPLRLDR